MKKLFLLIFLVSCGGGSDGNSGGDISPADVLPEAGPVDSTDSVAPDTGADIAPDTLPDTVRMPDISQDLLVQQDVLTDTPADKVGADVTQEIAAEVLSDLPADPGPCSEDEDCEPWSLVCDPLTEQCVDCLFDDQCEGGFRCEEQSCVEIPVCDTDDDCEDPVGLCDPVIGECVGCLEDAHCEDAPGPWCLVDAKVCVSCVLDEHCPVGQVCLDLECVELLVCETANDCPGAQLCNVETGQCVDCLDDDGCGEGQICGQEGACVPDPSCDSDKDCKFMNGVCDKEAGLCVECMEHFDCPEIYNCQAQVCVLDLCLPGPSLCQDGAVVACNGVGDGWDLLEICGEQQSCSIGDAGAVCLDWVCDPGSVVCEEEVLIQCSDDGLAVLSSQDCSDENQVCEQGGCLDVVCVPGSTACAADGLTLQTCSEKGGTVSEEPCPAGTFCEAGEEPLTAACAPQLCTPDLPVCDGTVATICNELGSGYLEGGMDCADEGLDCIGGGCMACQAEEVCDGLDNDCDGQVDEQPTDCGGAKLCSDGVCYNQLGGNGCTLHAWGGHVYAVCHKKKKWQDAMNICATWYDSILVVLESAEEEAFLLTKVDNKQVWMGMNDFAEEGVFQWIQGGSDYTHWCQAEPNDWGTGEDCATFNFSAYNDPGCWNDRPCDKDIDWFICEYSIPPS